MSMSAQSGNKFSTATQQVNLSKQQRKTIGAEERGLLDASRQQNDLLSSLAERSAALSNQVRTPGDPGSLDSVSRGLIANDQQNRNNQVEAQKRDIQARFGSGPLAKVLMQQAEASAMLGGNNASQAAALNQGQRQAQDNANISAAQNVLGNQASLGQQELSNRSALLQSLGQVGELLGGRTMQSIEKSSSKGGGFGA